MPLPLPQLVAAAEALQEFANALADAMRLAADALHGGGPPPLQLSQELTAYANDYDNLLRQSIMALGWAEPPADLQDLLMRLRAAQRQDLQRLRAREESDRAARVCAVRPGAVDLGPVLAAAQEWRAALASAEGAEGLAAELDGERHPLSDLLELVDRGQALDHAAWTVLADAVRAAFGTEVAAAAARGQLMVEPLDVVAPPDGGVSVPQGAADPIREPEPPGIGPLGSEEDQRGLPGALGAAPVGESEASEPRSTAPGPPKPSRSSGGFPNATGRSKNRQRGAVPGFSLASAASSDDGAAIPSGDLRSLLSRQAREVLQQASATRGQRGGGDERSVLGPPVLRAKGPKGIARTASRPGPYRVPLQAGPGRASAPHPQAEAAAEGAPALGQSPPAGPDADDGARDNVEHVPAPIAAIPPGGRAVVLGASPSEVAGPAGGAGPAEAARPAAEVSAQVWRLLAGDQAALAFHLQRALRATDAGRDDPLPPALLQLLALGQHVQRPFGGVAGAIDPVLPVQSRSPDINLLAWAAGARPALVAPLSGAVELLDALHLPEGFDHLFQLTCALVEAGRACRGLSPAVIKGSHWLGEWRAEVEGVQREAADWWVQAPRHTILYARATEVWKQWISPSGPVAALMRPLLDAQPEEAARVRVLAAELSGESRIARLLLDTERSLGIRQHVESRALRQLKARLHAAVELARRWAELIARRPEDSNFLPGQVEALRHALHTFGPGARHELQGACARHADGTSAIAAACGLRALEGLEALFSAERGPEAEPAPAHVLGGGLLRVPPIDLDADWGPQQAASELVELLMTSTACSDWPEAFTARVARGDLDGAERIVELLEAHGASGAADLRLRWARELEEHRRWLQRRISETRALVESTFMDRLIAEEQRSGLDARIVAQEGQLQEVRRFWVAAQELEAIAADLTASREEAKGRLSAELERLQPDLDAAAAEQVRGAIACGDLVAAQELLGRAALHEHLSAHRSPTTAFDAFFPQGLADVEGAVRAAPSWAPILQGFQEHQDVAGMRLSDLPPGQLRTGEALLRAWLDLKRAKRLDAEALRRLLGALGFQVQGLASRKVGGVEETTAQVQPVCEREICAVPSFGSLVEGRYRILWVWSAVSMPEVVNAVGETAHLQHGTIVLYFDRIGAQQRRELADLCRRKRRSFLVLDDLLALFLAGQPGLRLAALFACTLPFTYCLPYSTASSLVPPEMFYGRTDELQWLTDPANGQCFVYGGRQLGKTALLREAARRFHAPAEGRWAVWIDLKSEGIGIDRGSEQIWRCLARELERVGISLGRKDDPNPDISGRVEKFIDAAVAWLNEDERRRLLLLLDEADRFLEQEGLREFNQSARLKGLMDRTQRRFKVVFSGLHNVLRTTEQANHPLAHLGEPINVGPLLHNGEWHDARELVERPLRALGYRFSPESLIIRVLGLCNFFPSLVQLYCGELLRHLTDPHLGAPEARSGPPYEITERHVDGVYRDGHLRSAIREKFQYTLQLDQRYDTIAYLIAYAQLEEPHSVAQGFSVAEIRDRALEWWRAGFTDLTHHELSALLDEMEGLGVLRRLPGARYTLRSPNVVLLMGTREEIESAVLKERELGPTFDPATFRARSAQDAHGPERHPLTFREDGQLRRGRHAVSVVSGHTGAGIEDLAGFVRESTEHRYFVDMGGVTDPAAFGRQLRTLQNRPSGATTVAVVPPRVPWTKRWVDHALAWTQRLKAADRAVHVLFIADPRGAWALEDLDDARVNRVTLRPWSDAFLSQWLDDVSMSSDTQRRERIRAVTGNWSGLLLRWLEAVRGDSANWQAHLEALDAELRDPQQVVATFWPMFGLDLPEARRPLAELAKAYPDGPVSNDDLSVLEGVQGVHLPSLRRSLDWGQATGIVQVTGPGEYRLDTVAARLLVAAPP